MFETLENRQFLSVAALDAFVVADNSARPGGPSIDTPLAAQPGPIAIKPLSEVERADLLAMARDEKLARDVYTALYAKWGSMVFRNIAASEQQHLNAVSTLMTKYRLANPVATLPAGQFDTPAVQTLYDDLVARGSASLAAAMQVGIDIEQLDIRDLRVVISHTTHADIKTVYGNLLDASMNHLAAFIRQLDLLQ